AKACIRMIQLHAVGLKKSAMACQCLNLPEISFWAHLLASMCAENAVRKVLWQSRKTEPSWRGIRRIKALLKSGLKTAKPSLPAACAAVTVGSQWDART